METYKLPGGAVLFWNTETFQAFFKSEMEKRLRIAGEVVKATAQQKLRAVSARAGGHSKPGDYPHANTGLLAKSVFVRAEGLEVIVGTNLAYGIWLEYGTAGGKIIRPKNAKALSWIGPDGKRKFAKSVKLGPIAARPWLRLTLMECSAKIRAIVEAPLGSGTGSLGVEYRSLAA